MNKMNLKKYKQLKEKSQKTGKATNGTKSTSIKPHIKVIEQEVEIVRGLVNNDVNKRNQQLRKLRKWMQLRLRSSFAFQEHDFMRIWKGLYYAMWMSDKPLVQEELCEQLAQLLQCFNGDANCSISFFNAFLRTMYNEWFGIDQWRIDKFQMLVRRMLRYLFRCLKSVDWAAEAVELLNEHLQKILLLPKQLQSIGLTMHVIDIYFEELAKVAAGGISANQLDLFIKPFVNYVAFQRDASMLEHCRIKVFEHLLYQSEMGRAYQEKYDAWKAMGFPTKNIDDLELIEQSADENEDEQADELVDDTKEILDPRAGNVDVLMPVLPLQADMIVTELQTLLRSHEFNIKRQKLLMKLLKQFQTYQLGEFPLGTKTLPGYKSHKSQIPLIERQVANLENLENEVYGVNRQLKQLNKRKRRKLLKSINYENVEESNLEEAIAKVLPNNKRKAVEKLQKKSKNTTTMLTGWHVESLQEEEQPAAKKPKLLPNDKPKKLKQTAQTPSKKQQQVQQTDNTLTTESTTTTKLNNSETEVTAESAEKSKTAIKPKPQSQPQLEVTVTAGTVNDEWTKPLADGEIEFFLPSRKLLAKKANANLVPNPMAKKFANNSKATTTSAAANTPVSKRVRIVTKLNKAQKPSDYIQQIKMSPDIPYNASQKPGKGLLKPNLLPSPINPFYKKKIGLRLPSDL